MVGILDELYWPSCRCMFIEQDNHGGSTLHFFGQEGLPHQIATFIIGIHAATIPAAVEVRNIVKLVCSCVKSAGRCTKNSFQFLKIILNFKSYSYYCSKFEAKKVHLLVLGQ